MSDEKPPQYPGEPDHHSQPEPYQQQPMYTNHGAPPPAGYNQGYNQQQSTVIVGQPAGATVIVQQAAPNPPSYLGFSIFVLLCCNLIFGLFALIFSIMSQSAAGEGDYEGARAKGKVAMALNIVGIILTIFAVVFVIIYFLVIIPATIFG